MTNKNHIPNDIDNPFVSVGDLLRGRPKNNLTIGMIVEAIENGNPYCWDRFGRYVEVDKTSVRYKLMLDLLADVYSFECGAPDSERHPLEEDEMDVDGAIPWMGWAKKALPEFNLKDVPQDPRARKSSETRVANTLYDIIAAICHALDFDISENNSQRVSTVLDYLSQIDKYSTDSTVRTHLANANQIIDAYNKSQKSTTK